MADEHRTRMFSKFRLFLFCLYVAGYVALRHYGEIVYREADKREGGATVREYIVGGDFKIPRWRRQVYRAFFSPLMVVEEEGRRAYAQGGDLLRDAGGLVRDFFP